MKKLLTDSIPGLRKIFYESDFDYKGSRVWTNLTNTVCPRCGAAVEPNVEHLCGNRAPITYDPDPRNKKISGSRTASERRLRALERTGQ